MGIWIYVKEGASGQKELCVEVNGTNAYGDSEMDSWYITKEMLLEVLND